jgi:molybdopterin-guanine dinucleotide biosynthesis protein A
MNIHQHHTHKATSPNPSLRTAVRMTYPKIPPITSPFKALSTLATNPTNPAMSNLKTLLLAGGHSSRMGTPKHMLPLPSTGQPLYQHLIRVIHASAPDTKNIYISIATTSSQDAALQYGVYSFTTATGEQNIELVKIADDEAEEIGPAAGLLAAHRYDPDASWLVVACDFPLLEAGALRQLREAFEPPVTCFVNGEGFAEPLLAIWTPEALRSLKENVGAGRTGPSYTIKCLGGKGVSPVEEGWIVNTNTPEEWEAVRERIKLSYVVEGV